jgi:hypothetical protein
VFFGAYDELSTVAGDLPVPEYPPDATDEG